MFVMGTNEKVDKIDLEGRESMLLKIVGCGNEKQREKMESQRNRAGFRPVDYLAITAENSAAGHILKAASPYFQRLCKQSRWWLLNGC